ACISLAQAMRARSLSIPLAANVSATLPGLSCLLPHIAKLNVTAGPFTHLPGEAAQLGALIDAANAAGCVIQWEVTPNSSPSPSTGEAPPSPSLEDHVDSALTLCQLCRARGFERYLLAIAGVQAIPAYRQLAARL